VSELERSSTDSAHDGPPPAQHDNLAKFINDLPAPEREGLPRGYRMRADSHYVDQLESQRGGPAIRLIPTRQVDSIVPTPPARLEALAQSIADHGILQPLIVRRHNGRFQLIAGRKRLAAAVSVGVTEVPCLVYDVDEAAAAELARADNLRGSAPSDHNQMESSGDADCMRRVFRDLSAELAGIGSTATMFRPTANSPLQQRVAADLIQAQSWRAAWLTGAAAVVAHQQHEGRVKPIASILDGVKAGFEAEARLTSLQLDCSVSSEAAGYTCDEDLGVLAVAGCVFATLSWMDGLEQPHMEVRADAPTPRTLKIEVVQRMTPVPAEMARSTLGLLIVKSLAVQHGGTAEFTVIGSRGSVISSTFCKPNAN
jgi:hypothetical protein